MRRFGLIGYPLSHSFSKKYFADQFALQAISDCRYDNFPLASIDELPELLQKNPDLKGLNVTIPYKEQVIPFLDQMNDVVQATGACNCIRIEEGRLSGFNTDAIGFELTLKKKLLPSHQHALVLGSGGANKAVLYVLDKLGITATTVSRSAATGHSLRYDQLTERIIRSNTLIINTTPLGMFPDVTTAPGIDYAQLGPEHYLYDLVYNPSKTLFLQKGEQQGAAIENGYDMLIIQAEESWKIWNS